MEANLIHITIDGKEISVPKGTTVYQAAAKHGIEIPIFCYHNRMPPFGACRMCLVEVDKMPKLQASCTLIATEGMVVKTQSELAKEGRQGIIELLLINHPLDCPICDRGGECPLQDNAMSCGPGKSRFYEEKRHFKKPLPLGPVLMLDRERCIACARCTRFGDLVAGDHALEFVDRGFKTEVGTKDGGPAKSKFIGNTIKICPVGALTSRVYRFQARPWDNQPAKSTCTLCPIGCSMIIDSRDGEIMRTRSLENKEVNDIWLCDKGWFGYEFSSHSERLDTPLIRKNGKLEPASWEEALCLIAEKIKEAVPNGKIAAFGGNPLTTEENYLFQKLMRGPANTNHIDHRIGMPLFSQSDEGAAPGMEISIGDCESLSFALLLGIDITEEFPLIWLRLKQAINQGATTLFLGHYAPEIAQHLSKVICHTPGQEMEELDKQRSSIKQMAASGKKGAIFVGRQYLSSLNRLPILSFLFKLQKEFPQLSINILEGSGNSEGARFAGLRPDLLPQGKQHPLPGFNAVEVLEHAANSGWDLLYVAGANPAEKYPSALWSTARSKIKCLIVQDLFVTPTAKLADIVLPTLSFVEKTGTFINIEGRKQKLCPGKVIPVNVLSDGQIFINIAEKLGYTLDIDDDFKKALEIEKRLAIKREIINECVNKPTDQDKKSNDLFACSFAPTLFDQGQRMQRNSHLIQFTENPRVCLHPKDGFKLQLQTDDRITIRTETASITAKIRLDKGVAEKAIVIPLGFSEIKAEELGTNLMNGMLVNISKTPSITNLNKQF